MNRIISADMKKTDFLLQLFSAKDETGVEADNGTPADAGQESICNTEGEAATETESTFEELIKGRFASEFAKKTQRIIDKRFKETKLLETRVKENDRLFARLGGLIDADFCGDAELDCEELYNKLEQRLRSVSTPCTRDEMRERAERLYPSFDESRCLAQPEFKAYIERGLDYAEAYTLTNLEQIKREAVKEGAREAVRSISTMGRRPAESGLVEGQMIKRDVASLTPSEVRVLIDRAGRGEKIKLRDL